MSLCCSCVITCSGGQLKWGLCVVLRPILQGALHIRSIIQQQLWQRWEGGGGGEERGGEEGENKKEKKGGRVQRKKTGRGRRGDVRVRLGKRKNLNWWKTKPARKH